MKLEKRPTDYNFPTVVFFGRSFVVVVVTVFAVFIFDRELQYIHRCEMILMQFTYI